MRGFAGKCVAFLFLALIGLAAPAAEIWYEDNNLGTAASMPADFIEKFQQLESFRQASGHIRVYMMRANVMDKLEDSFLATQFASYVRNNNIKLAINSGGATWTQLGGRRAKVFEMNIALLERLKRLGVEVHYISLQSVLSKMPRIQGKTIDYPLSKRIEDIVSFSKAVRAIYPRVEIGIIDALPSHGKEYRQPYCLLKETMARERIGLSYIHLDMPFEIPKNQLRGITWQRIREVESYVEDDLGLRFGFFTTSRRGGQTSSKAFHEAVMAALDCYAGATGTPEHFIIASWFRHPQRTIPENAIGDDYPAMRTVLEFGRRLETIKRGGPSWVAQRAGQQDWRAQCGIH